MRFDVRLGHRLVLLDAELIRDDARRALLFDLDVSIRRLSADHPEHASVVSLTAVYHNLRQWAKV